MTPRATISPTALTRCDWIKLTGAAALLPEFAAAAASPSAVYRPIDGTKAKAIPTLCFGCTT